MTRPAAAYVTQTLEGPDGEPCVVMVNLGESPITWLHVRGKITERQYRAAEALRRDWERAGLGPQVTMHWNPAPVAKGRHGAPRAPDPTLTQMAAHARFTAAIAAAGPGLTDILWRVVCAGEGLTAAEKALNWPTRAGKLVLTLALDRVAAFYRLG